jgi:hypothetical protein
MIFLFLLFSSLVMAEGQNTDTNDEFSGVFNITVPANRLLRSFELGVARSDAETVISGVETQGNPEEMEETITVGQGLSMRFQRDYKQRVRYRSEKTASSEAWFYLYGRADRVTGFSILPSVYTKEDNSMLYGKTDKVFAIDLYEVNRPGDTTGSLLGTIENLDFVIGEYNDINFAYDITNGRRFAVRLYAMETEESHLIAFHTAKLGIYPGKLLKSDKTEDSFYRAQVRFYFERAAKGGVVNKNRVMQGLTDEINSHIRNSPHFGKDVKLEIPLELNMKLAPEGALHYSIKAGPPSPPAVVEEPKKKRSFLGF